MIPGLLANRVVKAGEDMLYVGLELIICSWNTYYNSNGKLVEAVKCTVLEDIAKEGFKISWG